MGAPSAGRCACGRAGGSGPHRQSSRVRAQPLSIHHGRSSCIDSVAAPAAARRSDQHAPPSFAPFRGCAVGAKGQPGCGRKVTENFKVPCAALASPFLNAITPRTRAREQYDTSDRPATIVSRPRDPSRRGRSPISLGLAHTRERDPAKPFWSGPWPQRPSRLPNEQPGAWRRALGGTTAR